MLESNVHDILCFEACDISVLSLIHVDYLIIFFQFSLQLESHLIIFGTVCTAQFVVMFTGCNGPEDTKRSCCAYISRSTRYLRSLLKEQVRFIFFWKKD